MKWLLSSTALALSMSLATAAYADDAVPQPPAESAMPASNAPGDVLVDESGKTTPSSDAIMVSDLVGATAIGPDGKEVGTVDDLVLGAGGKIEQVIIADGAIFGLGGKKVMVDFEGSAPTDPTPAMEGSMRASGAATDRPSGTGTTNGSGNATASGYMATPGALEDPVLRVSLTEESLDGAAEFDKSSLEDQGDRLASSFIDRDVKLAASDAEGEISDLLLDQSGTVKYAIIAFGGVLNIGGSEVAVDMDKLSGAPKDQPMQLAMTEAELQSAPRFDAGR